MSGNSSPVVLGLVGFSPCERSPKKEKEISIPADNQELVKPLPQSVKLKDEDCFCDIC